MSSVGTVGERVRHNIEPRQSWLSPTTLKVMKLIGTIAASCLVYAMGNARGWHGGHIEGYYEGRVTWFNKGFDAGQALEKERCAEEFMEKCWFTTDGKPVMYPSQPRN